MRLSDYLEKTGEKPTQFARRAGLSHSTVLRLMSGDRDPGGKSVREILKATGGKVTAADLYLADTGKAAA